MGKKPLIGAFLDEEEKAIYEAIEADDFEPVSHLTPERRKELQEMARNTIRDMTQSAGNEFSHG